MHCFLCVGHPVIAHIREFTAEVDQACLQFLELGFEMYEGGYTYAAVLLLISVMASFLAVRVLYTKRMELYRTIQQQHAVPIVTAGRVR